MRVIPKQWLRQQWGSAFYLLEKIKENKESFVGMLKNGNQQYEMESTIHTDLTKLFQDNKNLRIAHININGLQKSLDELKLLVLCADLDILAISETHLCDTTSDNDIMIENYELLRNSYIFQEYHPCI